MSVNNHGLLSMVHVLMSRTARLANFDKRTELAECNELHIYLQV